MNRPEGEPLEAGSSTIAMTENRVRLATLFAEHHRRILSAAYRITGSIADAEDVTQAVFLRLLGSDEKPVENAGSYLYRAAINGALDLLRKRKRSATEPLEDAAGAVSAGQGSSPEAEAASKELGHWLRLAISELSPRAAEMFTLRYVEELGNPEIAVLMGTSATVVAVTLFNARSRLKKRLKELERGTR